MSYSLVRAVLSPRWALDAVALVALTAAAILGIAVERTIAYTVGGINVPNSANNVVYGNWIESQFNVSATISGDASTGVNWTVSDLPDNTSYRIGSESVAGSSARATVFIEQVEGTPGPDAGTYNITVIATGSDSSVQNDTLELVVQQRPVRVSGTFAVSGKTYDSTTAANILSQSLSLQATDGLDTGKLPSDDLNLTPVATFDVADAGSRTATLVSSTLSGEDAANYSLDLVDDEGESYTVPTASATITAKALALDPTSLTFSKTYDGLTAISPTGTPTVDPAGLEGSDSAPTVSGSPTWVLDDVNVGTNKSVSISSGSYSLSDSNYTLATTSLGTASVTRATLTVNFTVSSRAYNGSADVTAQTSISSYTGRASSDSDVTASFSGATSASAGVGTHTVTLSGLSLNSAQAEANYNVVAQSGRTVTISKKTLTLGGSLSATSGEYDKVYDGTRDASGDTSSLALVGVEDGDTVTLSSATLQFSQADVGTGITVSVSAAVLGGADSGNYQISVEGAPTASAEITAFELTLGATVSPKTYDGTADVTVVCTVNTFSDGLNVAADCSTASFDNGGNVVLLGGVAQAHTISITSITLTNNTAGNYSLPSSSFSTTGVINPKQLTISGLTGVDRVYDATTNATVTGSETLVGVEGSDDVSLDSSGRAFSFEDKNVETGKAITASGYELAGTDSGNYTLAQPSDLSADITDKTVSAVVAHEDRVYNGTTGVWAEDLTVTLQGAVSGDDVEVMYDSAAFDLSTASQRPRDDANPDFRVVTVSGLSLVGEEASNYALASTSASDDDVIIQKRTIVLDNRPRRVYQPGADSGGAVLDSNVTVVTFDDGELLSEHETSPEGRVRLCDQDNNCSNDNVAFSVTVTFDSPYVGFQTMGWDGQVTASGNDADNYIYELSNSIVVDETQILGRITARSLDITGFSATEKVYDGSKSASSAVSLNDGLSEPGLTTPAGETASLSLIGEPLFEFRSQFVGTTLDIRVSNLDELSILNADVNGDGDPEYQLSTWEYGVVEPRLYGDITVKNLSIGGNFTVADRDYDTTNVAVAATNDLTLEGVATGDAGSVSLTGLVFEFESADANESVPTNISITSAGLTERDIDGDGTNEYELSLDGAPTATATISRYDLDPSLRATVSNKVYDSTTSATVTTVTVTDLAGDDVTVASGYAGVFTSEDVGDNVSVNLSGLTLQGTKKDNYSLSSSATVSTSADITARELTITGITASNKTYDRTTNTFFAPQNQSSTTHRPPSITRLPAMTSLSSRPMQTSSSATAIRALAW